MNAKSDDMMTNGKCPSVETVSAWVDGCFSSRDPESIHIANCPKCQCVAESFRHADAQLRQYLRSGKSPLSPEESAARIHLKISRHQHPPKRMRRPMDVFFRAVATIAFVACAGIIGHEVYKMQIPAEAQPESAVAAPETVKPVMADNAIKTEAHTSTTDELDKFRTNYTATPGTATVAMGDISMVSFGNQPAVSTESASAPIPARKEVVTIGKDVRHVWNVEDKAAAEELLQKLRKSITTEDVSFDAAKGLLSFKTRVSCQNLVQTVRAIAASGAELFVSDAPQPEQCCFSNPSDAMVDYAVEVHFTPAPKKN